MNFLSDATVCHSIDSPIFERVFKLVQVSALREMGVNKRETKHNISIGNLSSKKKITTKKMKNKKKEQNLCAQILSQAVLGLSSNSHVDAQLYTHTHALRT